MAIHSRNLAWRIPWTEEPGGLQSLGLQPATKTEHWGNGVGDLPSKGLSRAPPAEVQPQLIQGIRREDGVGDLFIYLFIHQRYKE